LSGTFARNHALTHKEYPVSLQTILENKAFHPWRSSSASELQNFVERRNRLYLLCTADEQRCLVQIAYWHAAHSPKSFSSSDPIQRSIQADFHHRYHLPGFGKANVVTGLLAKAGHAIHRFEERRALRIQSAFIAHLREMRAKVDDDVLLGVVHFLRMLPLSTLFGLQGVFEQALDELTSQLVSSTRVSAARRFDAVQRCINWAYAFDPDGESSADLHRHAWSLLLAVAQEDVSAAIRAVDEHWPHDPGRPLILSTTDLYEKPELAYQLARRLHPHRAGVAIEMLGTSLDFASFQLGKVEPVAATALEQVMDASCRLLAEWTFSCPTSLEPPAAVQTMRRLFRFSNPNDLHWKRLPREAMALLQSLPANDGQQLRLLAEVALYAPAPLGAEALQRFLDLVSHRFETVGEGNRSLFDAVRESCQALSILEETALSFRNHHIAANPDHPLLLGFERLFLETQARLLADDPASALANMVSLTLELSNERLFRQQHQLLRHEFEARARNSAADAGIALKTLIKYCGYSQMDDQLYRKHLCKETFGALLPTLEAISPTDAAMARSGVGWRPRGDI
jgi:hypothetical protein